MSNNYNSTLQSNNVDLQTILNTVNSLPNAGVGTPTLQTKTVSPTTSAQDVTADTGYDGLSKVTVNAMPTATQATPSITVNSSGLITATATQTAGYVSAGTKSATKQLTTQAAKTITPTKSSQTAVASGRYTTGTITVSAIPNTYIQPTGTLSITENGTHNVSAYASATVNVASGGGAGVDTCTVEVSQDYKTISYITVDQNNKLTYVSEAPANPGSIHPSRVVCACNTVIAMETSSVIGAMDLIGLELLYRITSNGTAYYLFKLTASAGETASMYLYIYDN